MPEISDIGSQLLKSLTSAGAVVVGVMILAGVIFAVAWYTKWRMQFIYDVEIKSKRSSGGNSDISSIESEQFTYKIKRDKGAFIRKKKDKRVWFRLLKENIEMPAPPLECIQIGATGKNYIKILQESDSEYYYLLPDTIDIKEAISGGKKVPLAQLKERVVDPYAAEWNVLRKRDNRKMFDVESILIKLAPIIGMVLLFILIIFLSYMIIPHWSDWAAAAKSLDSAADKLTAISQAKTTISSTTGG